MVQKSAAKRKRKSKTGPDIMQLYAASWANKAAKAIGTLTSFTCEICDEPSPSTQKFRHGNSYAYVHNICTKCVGRHIKARVEGYNTEIKCPKLNCRRKLDPLECRQIISPELFVKLCDSLCSSAVSGKKKCYCPHRDCAEMILIECGDDGSTNKFTCPRCTRVFCHQCGVPWRAPHWCRGILLFKRVFFNDAKFERLLEKMKWRRCPHCSQPVDRISGCNNVKCRCGREFCYDCGGPSHQLGACKSGEREIGQLGRIINFIVEIGALVVLFVLCMGYLLLILLSLFFVICALNE